MLFNYYSSLPEPVKKVIPFDDAYVSKLTTTVYLSDKYPYLHMYEKCHDCYRYQKTFKII